MKRMIKSAVDIDEVAEVTSKVSSIMEDYFVEYEGLSKEEAEQWYRVTLEQQGTGTYLIRVQAEIGYDEFQIVEPDLNKAVQSVDKGAYFDAETPGVFVCVIDTNENKEEEDNDPIFNRKNAKEAAESAVRQVSKSLGEDLKVTECEIGTDPEDDGVFRVFVTAENDEYEALAYVDLYKSETFSVPQLKADLIENLYSKLMNAVVHK